MNETTVQPMQCVFANSGLLRIDNIASGMGIVILHTTSKTAAGIHVLRAYPIGSKVTNPSYYVSTVIPYVLDEFKKKGILPPFSVAIAGGGGLKPMEFADVGAKMTATVKETLEKLGIKAKLVESGGAHVRSIILNIDNGSIKIYVKR